MSSFGRHRRPFVLTVLASIVLAVASCLATSLPARGASNFSLVILPDQGENAIYNFVNSATSSIDVTIYEFVDTTLVNDLIAREKAGVNVRVIMDTQHQSYDAAAYSALTGAGVGVVWSNSSFTYTHQKTITVDNKESYISTGNFDTTYYATSRDYGVFDTDANDVSAIVSTFNADYTHSSITPSDGDDLVWSPTDSQTHLVNLINGATKTLDIEQEEFSDTALINAIVSAAQRGVTVRVVLEDPSSYSSEVTEVENAGAKVTGYSSSTGFYIHAKTIIADYGTSSAKAFAGSENFSSNSLGNNRELGLITSDSGVVSGLESTFNGDFSGSAAGKAGIISPGSMTTATGAAVNYQVQAYDTATGSLSYSASGLPTGLSISSSTGVISGTASKAGTYSVTLTAKDSTGASGSASFTWTVGSSGGTGNTVTVTNPGSQSGTVGTAASLQVSASDSASGQTLTYTASGLPAGLSISSSGLISGTPTTAGTSTVTVTATDTTGATGSASFTWTIASSGGGGTCTASQLLGNPGFETGTASPWTASSGVIYSGTKEPAHSGSWDAWLDGYGKTTTDTLAQTVTLPTGCSTYTFSFWMHIDTAETTTTTKYDTLTLQVLNSSGTVLSTLYTYSNLNAASGYSQHTFTTLGNYAGQTITLKFTGSEDSEYQTSFVIDDTALNVS